MAYQYTRPIEPFWHLCNTFKIIAICCRSPVVSLAYVKHRSHERQAPRQENQIATERRTFCAPMVSKSCLPTWLSLILSKNMQSSSTGYLNLDRAPHTLYSSAVKPVSLHMTITRTLEEQATQLNRIIKSRLSGTCVELCCGQDRVSLHDFHSYSQRPGKAARPDNQISTEWHKFCIVMLSRSRLSTCLSLTLSKNV